MRNHLTTLGLCACLILGAGAVTMTAGCESIQPGVNNEMGTLVARVAATPDKTGAAAKATLEELQFQYIVSRTSKVDGYLTARTAQNEEIVIKINSSGDNVSEIKIRVGDFGDEGVSLRILDGIRAKI